VVYSDDVARASVLASERDAAIGRAYNLANYPPITQGDFVRLLAKIAGTPANLVHAPRERLLELGGGLSRPPYYFGAYLDLPSLTVRPDRAQSELGLAFTALEDGLRETFHWYQQQARAKPDYSWEDKALAALGRPPAIQ
jgi:nucleoside-diphosphate-sugar epimerase